MNHSLRKDKDYSVWLKDLKNRVRLVQIKAAVNVNSELLLFYWELGQDIAEKQKSTKWGDGFLKQLSIDLSSEFPDMKGFSKRNLELIRKWFRFWSENVLIVKQLATQTNSSQKSANNIIPIFQIPWCHNVVIITKIRNSDEALFYVRKTIQNNWSRSVLTHHISAYSYASQKMIQ